MKKLVLDNLNELFNENLVEDQVTWEYLKVNTMSNTILESTSSNIPKT